MKLTFRNIALSPFSLLYGLATSVRNLLYDKGLLKSTRFDFPVISVGNLTVGGTGKTPHIEFLIELLQKSFKVAVLSRGYKRRSKGFVLATPNSDSQLIGDEPFQMYRKFKKITVAVDEKRVNGVHELRKMQPEPDVILLDDAFQHRAINPGLKILLTDYSRLYSNDSLLPGGLLRECKNGSQRADMVIVTKCSAEITIAEMAQLTRRLNLQQHQKLFFSTIVYNKLKPVFDSENNSIETVDFKGQTILLVTGIVSNEAIVRYLKQQGCRVETATFGDHHHFTSTDYAKIEQKFIHLSSEKKIILVTEKDAARMVSSVDFPESLKRNTFYLPIRIQFLQNKEAQFTQNMLQYVDNHRRNS